MATRRPDNLLPLAARSILWHRLWDRLLAPPRREPAEPEVVPRPEDVADPELRSCGEGERP